MQSFLYKVPALNGTNAGQNTSKLILDCLNEGNIPLENFLPLTADTAPGMVGKNNVALAFLRWELKHLACLGCACHLINLPAQKRAACIPINIDDHVIDLYNYFERSHKQQEKFQNIHGKEMKKLLKHVST